MINRTSRPQDGFQLGESWHSTWRNWTLEEPLEYASLCPCENIRDTIALASMNRLLGSESYRHLQVMDVNEKRKSWRSITGTWVLVYICRLNLTPNYYMRNRDSGDAVYKLSGKDITVAQSHHSDLLPWYPLQIMALAIHVSLVCSHLVTKFFHVLWRYLMLHGPSITWILPDHVDFLGSSLLPNTF